MARITVGIPAYRTAYLSQAITSVLAQSFTDFELLISDDSLDGSAGVLARRFEDPRIRVIEGPRRGLAANSVHVWNHASADLLKYLYDDDLLRPSCLEAMNRLIDRRAYGYAFCSREIIDAAGEVVTSIPVFEGSLPIDFGAADIAAITVKRVDNSIGEPTSLLIRRSAFSGPSCLESYAGLPIRHLVDVAFYVNAADTGRCIGIPQPLAAFRMHPGQVSSDRGGPAYSAGLFEWEIFVRGCVQAGITRPADVLPAIPRLALIYGMFEAPYPELHPFRDGLADLESAARAGQTALLTDAFRAHVMAANAAIDARLSRGRP